MFFFFFQFLSDLIGKRKIKNQALPRRSLGTPSAAPDWDAEGPEGRPRRRLSRGSCDWTIDTPFLITEALIYNNS